MAQQRCPGVTHAVPHGHVGAMCASAARGAALPWHLFVLFWLACVEAKALGRCPGRPDVRVKLSSRCCRLQSRRECAAQLYCTSSTPTPLLSPQRTCSSALLFDMCARYGTDPCATPGDRTPQIRPDHAGAPCHKVLSLPDADIGMLLSMGGEGSIPTELCSCRRRSWSPCM